MMTTDAPGDRLRSVTLREKRMLAARATGGTSGEAIHRAVLSAAHRLALAGELLDFGAGAGILLEKLLASGFTGRATAVDIMPKPQALPAAVRWVEADLNDPVPLPDGSFDAIVSVEVIEHLENPRAVFREFHRLLKPRGTLVLTTPNQESLRSLSALALRGHFVDFLSDSYPAHITALVRRDFERIAAETGFDRPTFSYTDDGGVPRLPTVKWQTVSLGRLRGRLFSDNMLVVTRSADAC